MFFIKKALAGSHSSSLHTSSPVSGTRVIPDRLLHIPEADNPGFFEMVEYFFHKVLHSFYLLNKDLFIHFWQGLRVGRGRPCLQYDGKLKGAYREQDKKGSRHP